MSANISGVQFSNQYDRLMHNWDPTWMEFFTLPPGLHKEDIADPMYPQMNDLFSYTVPGIFIILFLRFILEGFVLRKLGYALGIKDPKKRPPHPPHHNAKYKPLEEVYKTLPIKRPYPSHHIITKLSIDTGLPESKITAWFRKRKRVDVALPVKKFAESAFKVIFYLCVFTYGMTVLIPSPWLWDMDHVINGFPYHLYDSPSEKYYAMELAYYMSCLLTLPFDNKRKDFMEMVVHHIATIMLLTFSYEANLWRMGSLVMAAHDVSDIFLETAKALNYAQIEQAANNAFILFALVFFVSRLVYFPFLVYSSVVMPVRYVLHESLWEYVTQLHFVPVHVIICTFLIVLLCLHMFWMSIILKMAIKFARSGTVEKDERSDNDYHDTDDEASEDPHKKSN